METNHSSLLNVQNGERKKKLVALKTYPPTILKLGLKKIDDIK